MNKPTTVSIDPVMEAIAKNLFGIESMSVAMDSTPEHRIKISSEKRRMIKRAAKAGRDACRVEYGQRIVELERDRNELVETLKVVYRKHILHDSNIGWDELSERMYHTMCNVLGDDGFEKFLKGE